MNLPQSLEIVKEHIRIGKGMELTNGVPEALEMVVAELNRLQVALEATIAEKELYKKALNLACDMIAKDFGVKTNAFPSYFLAQAKGGNE